MTKEYKTEATLVRRFVSRLHGGLTPWGRVRVGREFNFSSGRTDVIARSSSGEPSESGGGQLSYWFEEALLAFLREADLVRVRKANMFGKASDNNPFCQQILQELEKARSEQIKPKWLGLSWRQFLYWFADVEKRLAAGSTTARQLLVAGDDNWKRLDAVKVLMQERQNDGTWIRSWLNALNEFEA